MDQETKCSTEGEEKILPAMTSWVVAPMAQSTEEEKKKEKKDRQIEPNGNFKICVSKDNFSKVKRQLREWGKYLQIM